MQSINEAVAASQEIELSSPDRKLLLTASFRLLIRRLSHNLPVFCDDIARLVAYADEPARARRVRGYDAPPNADSQCGRILYLLESRRGEWVPLPEILGIKISQYGTRIKELHDDWKFAIENRIETIDGVQQSWFRLAAERNSELISNFMLRRREEKSQSTPLFAEGRP